MNEYTGTVIAGFDGSPNARSAVHWAANEAVHEHRSLHLLAAFDWVAVAASIYEPYAAVTYRDRALDDLDQLVRVEADDLRLRHPGLKITTSVHTGAPEKILLEASEAAHLMIVGSRGVSRVA